MKSFLVALLVAAVAVAQAKPSASVITPLAVSTPIATQYLAQDSIGQYTYGYSNPLSSKSESRSFDGITRGAYNYVDGEGKLQSVEYTSDAVHGFRVAASNLPVAPAIPVTPTLIAPEPVQDTPEVVEARAKHLVALKEAETRSAEAPASAVITKSETFLPSTFGLVIPSANLATVRLGAPILSYNYGIPGATVAYSAFAAPAAFSSYTTHVAAPIFSGFGFGQAVQAPAPAQTAAVESDSVTVEAKSAAPAETKEKSD